MMGRTDWEGVMVYFCTTVILLAAMVVLAIIYIGDALGGCP